MSTSTLPPRFTFGPPDTLGNAIFYRYYPYQATLARWDRTSAEAAANPYTTRLQMLQQQLDTERAELMQMMRALSAGATPMELRLEAEQRAALARAGRRGGGGGGGDDPIRKLKALQMASGITGQAGRTVLLAPGMNLRAGVGDLAPPSDAVLKFNADAAQKLQTAGPARQAQMAAALAQDPRIAAVKAVGADGETSLKAVAAARQAVIQGMDPQLAGAIYGVPAGATTEEGFFAVKQQLQSATEGGVEAPTTDTLAAPLAEEAARIALAFAEGAGGQGAGGRGAGAGAAVETVDPDKVLSEAERLAVQRYIVALANDGVATEEEYGEGFDAGKAAYEKAANLGEYTRAQAPYFNPEFLTRLGQVAQTKEAEGEQRSKFLAREERTPAEIEREQAKLFLESEMRAQGLVYLDPADYPDVAPWRLDTVPRAMRLLRDEGVDALIAPVEAGIKASPPEYGRMLAMMQGVTADEARELARKKFKNDERADLAVDYFFATKAAQQRGAMTKVQQNAAAAAGAAAETPPPAPPPAPALLPAPAGAEDEVIVFQPTEIEVVPPDAGDEMLAALRSVPEPSATMSLPPEAEAALRQMAIGRLLTDQEKVDILLDQKRAEAEAAARARRSVRR